MALEPISEDTISGGDAAPRLVRCALLDRERRVFLGMVEIDASQIDPEIHLTKVTECDLPVDQYRWQEDASSPCGGTFMPLPPQQRAKAARPTMEHAVAFDLLARREAGGQLPDATLAWLDDTVVSFDFVGYLDTPLVAAYVLARGLTPRKGS